MRLTEIGDPLDVPVVTLTGTTTVLQRYAYDAIGNIASTTGGGTYAYAETGYANPHAATSINGTNLSYDNNGNVTGYGGKGYTWNYKNLMTAAGASGATSTYAYGPNNERVSKIVGGVTTVFPNNLYEKSTATTTKHIYANGYLIGSVYGTGSTTASTTYPYPDHLNSTHLVISSEGDTIQTLEYTPWGAQDSNTSLTANQQSNRYIGSPYDEESDLSYLQARMYSGSRGQFMSQDPTFLAMGDPDKVKELTQQEFNAVLKDPQGLNSYSYARNNPIVFKDPLGNWYVYINGGLSYGFFNVQIGFEANDQGVNAVAGVGPSLGAEGELSAGFSSGSMPTSPEIQVEQSVGAAVGAGYEYSRSATVNVQDGTNLIAPTENVTDSHNITVGVGAAASQTYTVHIPLGPGTMIPAPTTAAPTTPPVAKPTTPDTKNNNKK